MLQFHRYWFYRRNTTSRINAEPITWEGYAFDILFVVVAVFTMVKGILSHDPTFHIGYLFLETILFGIVIALKTTHQAPPNYKPVLGKILLIFAAVFLATIFAAYLLFGRTPYLG